MITPLGFANKSTVMLYEKVTSRKPVKPKKNECVRKPNDANKEKNENSDIMRRNGNTTKHGRKYIKKVILENELVRPRGNLRRHEIFDLKPRYSDGKIISLRFNPLHRMRKWIYYCCGNRVMFRGRHPREWRRILQRRISEVL